MHSPCTRHAPRAPRDRDGKWFAQARREAEDVRLMNVLNRVWRCTPARKKGQEQSRAEDRGEDRAEPAC